MSIEIIKAGIADSIQDNGRFGYQHLGINTNGAMDNWAMRIANVLVGNPQHVAAIEMTFPAPRLKFLSAARIALTGADFKPMLNGHPVPVWQPVCVTPDSVLEFAGHARGSFCYLSVSGGLNVPQWLGSHSTNVLAQQGGMKRNLQTGDVIPLNQKPNDITEIRVLPVRVKSEDFYLSGPVKCITGSSVNRIHEETLRRFTSAKFLLHPNSNRMGYRLRSLEPLTAPIAGELSVPVTFGTIQLLPKGELIALMADHQTTGGYPVIGCIAQAFRSSFVQHRPGDAIYFDWIGLDEARHLFGAQVRAMQQLEYSCRYRFKDIFYEKN